MSRGHLAYPLVRAIDGDAGGAADLQTDIMRFMAILALCLLAIFALVQSVPPTPMPIPAVELPEPTPEPPAAAAEPAQAVSVPDETILVRPATRSAQPVASARPVVLTRPKPAMAARPQSVAPAAPVTERDTPPARPVDDKPGFTLRFESDLALTRLVATGQIGVFALSGRRAERMSVSGSQISFWAAPAPKQFHEMDSGTVPTAARDALSRTGQKATKPTWAVTLPPGLRKELDRILAEFQGGALVITKDGRLRREQR